MPNGIILSPDEKTLYVIPFVREQIVGLSGHRAGQARAGAHLLHDRATGRQERRGRRRLRGRQPWQPLHRRGHRHSSVRSAGQTAGHDQGPQDPRELRLRRQGYENAVCNRADQRLCLSHGSRRTSLPRRWDQQHQALGCLAKNSHIRSLAEMLCVDGPRTVMRESHRPVLSAPFDCVQHDLGTFARRCIPCEATAGHSRRSARR